MAFKALQIRATKRCRASTSTETMGTNGAMDPSHSTRVNALITIMASKRFQSQRREPSGIS